MPYKDYMKEVQSFSEEHEFPLEVVFKLVATCKDDGVSVSRANRFKVLDLLISQGWKLAPPSSSPSGTNGKAPQVNGSPTREAQHG